MPVESLSCPNCGASLPAGSSGMLTCRFCNSTVRLPTAPATGPDPETDLRVRTLLEQGEAVKAIQLYMTSHECSLKEARNAVSAIATGMGMTLGGGRGSRLVCPVLAAALLAWTGLLILLPLLLRRVLLAESHPSPGTAAIVQALITLVLVVLSAMLVHRLAKRSTKLRRTPPGH